ncbi:MAG: BlaI/MecI/CopY family transcriptional regulator [bacterium]|nr:BlaI/MecI/CopY family transcriptional regulator [bacterium]
MRISDSEMELMQIIWRHDGEITCGEVMDKLQTEWKVTTVQTFLKRLCDKGILHVRKEGKINFYTPALTEEEYKQEQTGEFLDTMHKGSVKSLLTALFGAKQPNREELEDIKNWFERL